MDKFTKFLITLLIISWCYIGTTSALYDTVIQKKIDLTLELFTYTVITGSIYGPFAIMYLIPEKEVVIYKHPEKK